MSNWSNSEIQDNLLRVVGRLCLGVELNGTRSLVKNFCDEVDRRIAVDADRSSPEAFYVSKELACIAEKARALLD